MDQAEIWVLAGESVRFIQGNANLGGITANSVGFFGEDVRGIQFDRSSNLLIGFGTVSSGQDTQG